MEITNKKENQIQFNAEMSESLANAIRRYVNKIPVLAIDEVEISKNDSPLYDETVAHRLGLVPLKGKTKEATLKLKSKGRGMVYAKDLKGNAEIVYGEIPITFLKKGEEVDITANAKLGIGVDHSKFSPGLMFYRNIVKIDVDKNCPTEVIDRCSKNILKVESGNVVAKNEENCDVCEACTEFCKKKGKDSIKIIPTKELLVTVESFGQLDVKDIFKSSIEILKKDLAEVGKKIK